MRGDIVPPKRPEDTNRPNPRQPLAKRAIDNSHMIAAPSHKTEALPEHGTPDAVDAQTPIDAHIDTMPAPDVEDTPKRRLKRKHMALGAIAAVLILIVVSVLGVFAWYNAQLTAVSPKSQEKVKVMIAPGSGTADVASLLKENDLIKSEAAFGWYVRLSGTASKLQSGSYRLSKSDDVPAIVKHLTSGTTDTFSITFLPGATLAKHRQVLIDAGYDEGQVDAALNKQYTHPLFIDKPANADLEGFIYGETYNFSADATPEQILTRTFDQFQSVVESQDLTNLYKRQGFSLYQGITLASIIQREVATPADAAQVAQVFKLRLDMDMQLGSDVTYQYIADKTGVARSVDLDSPYNTRRYAGLPPGPIASPGIDVLKAVGSPAPGDYVYFLSGDDDKTYFARTNEEHEQNIRDHCEKKCQII